MECPVYEYLSPWLKECPLPDVQRHSGAFESIGVATCVAAVCVVVLTICRPLWRRDKVLFHEGKPQFHRLLIESIDQVTPESKRFRLLLPDPDMRLGLEPGQFLKVHESNPLLKRAAVLGKRPTELMVNGKPSLEAGRYIARRYGMMQPRDERGYCEIVVKIYLPTDEYPDGGLMTGILNEKNVGDVLTISGPHGRVAYLGHGAFLVDGHSVRAKKLGMILGGTGVTPGFAIVQHILRNPEDKTQVSMIYGNRTYESILVRRELEEYALNYPNQFKLHLLLDDQREALAKQLTRKASMYTRRRQRFQTVNSDLETAAGAFQAFNIRPTQSLIRTNNVTDCGETGIIMGWSPSAHPENSTGTDLISRQHWGGTFGRVTRKLVKNHFPTPQEDPLIFMIGPPGMLLNCVRPALRELGFNLDRVLPF